MENSEGCCIHQEGWPDLEASRHPGGSHTETATSALGPEGQWEGPREGKRDMQPPVYLGSNSG